MANQLQLPIPDRLEPKSMKRTLMFNVRAYFYKLYNSTKAFRELLASVGNKDSVTGNRLFDRHNAVSLIKKEAKVSNDSLTENAKDGDVYHCLVSLMRQHELGLRLRKQQYRSITQQQPAE